MGCPGGGTEGVPTSSGPSGFPTPHALTVGGTTPVIPQRTDEGHRFVSRLLHPGGRDPDGVESGDPVFDGGETLFLEGIYLRPIPHVGTQTRNRRKPWGPTSEEPAHPTSPSGDDHQDGRGRTWSRPESSPS